MWAPSLPSVESTGSLMEVLATVILILKILNHFDISSQTKPIELEIAKIISI
jgi:hypothetical protein